MSTPDLTRRGLIGLSAAVLLMPGRVLGAARTLRFTAVGQSLILRTFGESTHPGFEELARYLQGADVAFTNLEVALQGPARQEQAPTEQRTYQVSAPDEVLDTLRQLHFNLLSLANNHADDLGEAGFLASIAAAAARGFGYAGTGRNLAEAARAGYLDSAAGRVALVAVASNAVPEEAIATAERTGVNHLRKTDGVLDAADSRRVLDAIAHAASTAQHVVVYHHDHYWHPDWQVTPEWKKRWARACIEAGANVFVGHGVPVLHGIELYRGRPIFYGLGNFIFNLTYHLDHVAEKFANIGNEGYTDPRVWQSVIAKCVFGEGRVQSITLRPISLATQKRQKPGGPEPTGNPRLVGGAEASQILERMQRLSEQYGVKFAIRGDQAELLV